MCFPTSDESTFNISGKLPRGANLFHLNQMPEKIHNLNADKENLYFYKYTQFSQSKKNGILIENKHIRQHNNLTFRYFKFTYENGNCDSIRHDGNYWRCYNHEDGMWEIASWIEDIVSKEQLEKRNLSFVSERGTLITEITEQEVQHIVQGTANIFC